MSMLVKGKCKKCGGYVQFDIGEMTEEEAKEALKSHKSWQCSAGNHMELMSPAELYTFDWDNLKEHKPMTEDEFCADLKTKFTEVYTSDELDQHYTVDSFLYGKCLCHSKEDEDKLVVFDFTQGPTGIRYYIAML